MVTKWDHASLTITILFDDREYLLLRGITAYTILIHFNILKKKLNSLNFKSGFINRIIFSKNKINNTSI